MPKAYASSVFEQSVDQVWEVLGDFHSIDTWMEVVNTSKPESGDRVPTVGGIRVLTLGDDDHSERQRLVALDLERRGMKYDLPDLPAYGMSAFVCTVRALPITDSDRTFVEWHATLDSENGVDAAEVAGALEGFFATFLGDLHKHLDGK